MEKPVVCHPNEVAFLKRYYGLDKLDTLFGHPIEIARKIPVTPHTKAYVNAYKW